MGEDRAGEDLSTIRQTAALFDTDRQAVIATTIEGEIVYWSDAAERLYGWSASEALGRSIVEITPSATSRALADAIMSRLRNGHSWTGEFPVRSRAGDEFTVEVRDVPVRSKDGTLAGIVGISAQVTASGPRLSESEFEVSA